MVVVFGWPFVVVSPPILTEATYILMEGSPLGFGLWGVGSGKGFMLAEGLTAGPKHLFSPEFPWDDCFFSTPWQ